MCVLVALVTDNLLFKVSLSVIHISSCGGRRARPTTIRLCLRLVEAGTTVHTDCVRLYLGQDMNLADRCRRARASLVSISQWTDTFSLTVCLSDWVARAHRAPAC